MAPQRQKRETVVAGALKFRDKMYARVALRIATQHAFNESFQQVSPRRRRCSEVCMCPARRGSVGHCGVNSSTVRIAETTKLAAQRKAIVVWTHLISPCGLVARGVVPLTPF